MATNKKSTTAATSMEPSSTRSRRVPNVSIFQNFHLVWLDRSIDEVNNDDCRNSITKLQQVVNIVNTFVDVDECIDFITEFKQENTFIIVCEAFIQKIVPTVQEIPQVSSVYISCKNKASHEKWAQQWSKVEGVFTDITSICEALKKAAQVCDQNSISLSFVKSADELSHRNLDTLDQSFMYTQILKEILLTIDFDQAHINEFLTYCREQLVGNTVELQNVDKIEKEYHQHPPIWWYTYPCFLYSMLNRALRLMEIDIIIKMGFFVQKLHNNIAAFYLEQYGGQNYLDSFTVYRGQGLSQADFDQLKQTQDGLLSFNNFLSTSKNADVSLKFARQTMTGSSLVGVLFVMKIDPSISATPFANIQNVSRYQREEEILFSMHSVFRIGQMKQIDKNSRLWQVDLTLTNDNDPELHVLAESMRKETLPGYKGWYRLGYLLIRLGQSDKAQQIYNIMLDQTTEQGEKADIYHMIGMIKNDQGKYAEAIRYHEESIKIRPKNFFLTDIHLGNSYSSIGSVYQKMSDYPKALLYFEKAFDIEQKTLPENHPNLATSYNNIGLVYCYIGESSKALSYFEKALEIRQKTLPANHPDLATSYNNIGEVYNKLSEYSKALSSHEKALEIRQKILPLNHPNFAQSYNNIGAVYYNMSDYSKALSYFERACDTFQRSLPPNHPDLQTVKASIENVKKKL